MATLELDNQARITSLLQVEPYIINLYKGGKSTVELAKMFKFSPEAIRRFLRRRKIRIRQPSETARKHTLNHQYFDDIKSKEQAYWLGFMLTIAQLIKKTDGSWMIIVPTIKERRYLLHRLAAVTNSSRPLYIYKKRNRIAFTINSTNWAEALIKLGWDKYKQGDHQQLLNKIDHKLHKSIHQGCAAATE